jgi:hypothetical protein
MLFIGNTHRGLLLFKLLKPYTIRDDKADKEAAKVVRKYPKKQPRNESITSE